MVSESSEHSEPKDQGGVEVISAGLLHKEKIAAWAAGHTKLRQTRSLRNRYFENTTKDFLEFLVLPGSRVLALGCGVSDSLARLKPSFGVGVDLDHTTINIAKQKYPQLEYIRGDIEDPAVLLSLADKGPFDIILLEDTLGYLIDIQEFLTNLKSICIPETRLISIYYGYLWEPLLKLSENLGLRDHSFDTTWLRMGDVENFLLLSGFEAVKKEWRILFPYRWFGIGNFVNRYVATLPVIRKICIRHFVVARPLISSEDNEDKVSVIIPCRNEKGNIEPIVRRLPKLGSHTEIIFVEGHSHDSTWEELNRVKDAYPSLDIHILRQAGVGKGDAVRAGFERSTGHILIVLDADMTVPPEDLPKFVGVISSGKGEYVNGSRLIYGMENQAMRFLNYLANHLFAYVFTFLINQKLTDTLCGTKVIKRKDYARIAANRHYFGDFDPFGDFDLIFGASRLNLKFVELPVRYASRRYGKTQISRFSHGLLLLKMVLLAYRKLKVI